MVALSFSKQQPLEDQYIIPDEFNSKMIISPSFYFSNALQGPDGCKDIFYKKNVSKQMAGNPQQH